MTNKLYKPLLIETVKATVNIEQHRFIGFDGKYCANGKKALGVSDVSTEQNQAAPVAVLGILIVTAGDTITQGDAITSNEEGKAVKVISTEAVNGFACENATAGEEVRILRGA